jgi:hypothetical protein|tara:strand:+ start:989 stop:1285 length:297 start_codon:yes stop_codon:yes gene_type:complete
MTIMLPSMFNVIDNIIIEKNKDGDFKFEITHYPDTNRTDKIVSTFRLYPRIIYKDGEEIPTDICIELRNVKSFLHDENCTIKECFNYYNPNSLENKNV